MDEYDLFTVDEIAAFLRTDSANVRRLLEDGSLVGFRVDGEWRVLGLAIVDFVKRQMQASKHEAFTRALVDKRRWARSMLRDAPDLVVRRRERTASAVAAPL
jgi:hypothetical protein